MTAFQTPLMMLVDLLPTIQPCCQANLPACTQQSECSTAGWLPVCCWAKCPLRTADGCDPFEQFITGFQGQHCCQPTLPTLHAVSQKMPPVAYGPSTLKFPSVSNSRAYRCSIDPDNANDPERAADAAGQRLLVDFQDQQHQGRKWQI